MGRLGLDPGVRDPEGAEVLARRLDGPMAGLGLVFVLVVLGQVLAEDARLVSVLILVGWVLWSVFVVELLLRAYVAGDQRTFWSRNWWQLVFLAVPFLRFARVLTALRAARVGAVVGAAVRGSRSAGRVLSSRVWWLGVVTVIVALASSQLLYALGSYDSYGAALHAAALATITGEPLKADDGFAQVLGVALAAYSVVVFATVAAALGAYFLRLAPGVPVDLAREAGAQFVDEEGGGLRADRHGDARSPLAGGHGHAPSPDGLLV